MSDLLAHIAGEGVESVQKYVQNPKLLEERSKNSDYEKNFLYCFSDKSDWQMLELDYYKQEINDFLSQIEVKKLKPNTEQKKIMTEIENGVFENCDYQDLTKLFGALDNYSR